MPPMPSFLKWLARPDVRWLVGGLVAYAAIGYLNKFAAQNQVDRRPNCLPLYDRVHQTLPIVRPLYPNLLLVALLTYFVVRWGLLPFARDGARVLTNYVWILVFLFLGRIVTFTSTQLPPPREGCSVRRPGDPIRVNVFRKGWKKCSNLMYSGHTFHSALVSLFVLYLAPSRWERVAVLVAAAVELVLVVAARLHYTADVLVALIITVLIFYAWPGVGTHASWADFMRHIRRPPLFTGWHQHTDA